MLSYDGQEFPSKRVLMEHINAARKSGTITPTVERLLSAITGAPAVRWHIIPSPGRYAGTCWAWEDAAGVIRDISIRKAVSPPTPLQVLTARARELAEPQIAEFREVAFAAGAVHCAATGKLLTRSTAEVDHERPFVELLLQHVMETIEDQLSGGCTSITPGPDAVHWLGVGESWMDFHREHAVLRMIHRDVNRALGAGVREPLLGEIAVDFMTPEGGWSYRSSSLADYERDTSTDAA